MFWSERTRLKDAPTATGVSTVELSRTHSSVIRPNRAETRFVPESRIHPQPATGGRRTAAEPAYHSNVHSIDYAPGALSEAVELLAAGAPGSRRRAAHHPRRSPLAAARRRATGAAHPGQQLPAELPGTSAAGHEGLLDPAHLKVIQTFIADLPGDVAPAEQEEGRPDGMSVGRLTATPEMPAMIDAWSAMFAAPGMCDPDDQTPVVSGEPSRNRDARGIAQRQHDALAALLGGRLGDPARGSHNGLPVTVIVSADLGQICSGSGHAVTAAGTLVPMRDVIRMASHAWHYLYVFDNRSERALYLAGAASESPPPVSESCCTPRIAAVPRPGAASAEAQGRQNRMDPAAATPVDGRHERLPPSGATGLRAASGQPTPPPTSRPST